MYYELYESTPEGYGYKLEPHNKGKGGCVATIYSNIFNVPQQSGFEYNSFEVVVLSI